MIFMMNRALFIMAMICALHGSGDKADQCLQKGILSGGCRNPKVLNEVAFRAQIDPHARALVEHDLKVSASQSHETRSCVIIHSRDEAMHAAAAAASPAQSSDGCSGQPATKRVGSENGCAVYEFASYNERGVYQGMRLMKVPASEPRRLKER